MPSGARFGFHKAQLAVDVGPGRLLDRHRRGVPAPRDQTDQVSQRDAGGAVRRAQPRRQRRLLAPRASPRRPSSSCAARSTSAASSVGISAQNAGSSAAGYGSPASSSQPLCPTTTERSAASASSPPAPIVIQTRVGAVIQSLKRKPSYGSGRSTQSSRRRTRGPSDP